MRILRVAAAMAACAAAAFAGDERDGGQTVALVPKAMRKFDVLLPAERYAPVAGGFAVPHKDGGGGERFAARADGEILRVDLDGDGELESEVDGTDGFVTLHGESAQGRPLAYSVRLRRGPGEPWSFSCGGAMSGAIDGTPILLIDQDLDGNYAGIGTDAMVVGAGGTASYLSSVVSIGGKLLSIEVEPDGASLRYRPFAGDAGTLDMLSGFECKARLDALVVTSADGRTSFSLADGAGGTRVPAGDYRIACGRVALGDFKATLLPGRAEPIRVGADAVAAPQWGGPVKVEFACAREGDSIGFSPWDIWFHGRLGEEYVNFLPLGKSPEFTIKPRAPGEPILRVKFPGNC